MNNYSKPDSQHQRFSHGLRAVLVVLAVTVGHAHPAAAQAVEEEPSGDTASVETNGDQWEPIPAPSWLPNYELLERLLNPPFPHHPAGPQ